MTSLNDEDNTTTTTNTTIHCSDTSYISDKDDYLIDEAPQYRTYHIRWYVLLAFILLAYSNGLSWLLFAPIPKFTAAFYGVTVDQANYLTIIFFIGSVVASLPAMFVLDFLSLRETIWIGNFINALGTIIRVVSAYLPGNINYLMFSIAMLGQFVTSLAQPFSLFSPPKLANVWFAGDERVLANTLSTISNVVGIGTAMILAPALVTNTTRLQLLLCITAAPAIISLIASAGVWKRKPFIPPSSSSVNDMSIWQGFKSLVRNYQFLFLLIVWSIICGLFNVILTLLPQFLCPFGYTNLYGGVVGAIMVFSGLAGALIFGFIVDKTKLFEEVSKGALCLASLAIIFLMEVFSLPNQHILIGFACMLVGFFALIELPLFTELAIEVSYPVPEGTCTGLMWTGAQLMGALFTIIAPLLTSNPNQKFLSIDKCNLITNSTSNISVTSSLDYMYFFYLMNSIMVVIIFLFVLFFWPKYRRIEHEKLKKQQAAKDLWDSMVT